MSAQEPSVHIDTPENVLLEAEIAGFGNRSLAALIDYLIIAVLLIALGLFELTLILHDLHNSGWEIAIYILVMFGVFTFYHLLFEFFWNGQTPGKRSLKIRVVQANGMPLTVSGLLIRNLIRLFDFLPAFYGIGLLTMFATKHTQRLGDLAARTIVVREHPQVTLQTIRENLRVQYLFINHEQKLPGHIDITPITQADRRTIVSFLQRRHNLSGRENIAVSLANRLAAAMNAPERKFSDFVHAETFLEYVARAFELADQQHSEDQANPRAFS